MNVSLYQAAAGMNAQERWQEMITQNLAAGNVPGFRKQEISFANVAASSPVGLDGASNSNFYLPTPISSTSFQQGEMRPTGDSTDLALDGPGFFQVQMANGQTGYTRNGQFQLNAQGQLVTNQGYHVMGNGGPIQLNPAGGSQFTVAANGQITQGGNVIGRLNIVEFANPGQLTASPEGYLLANDPSLTPTPTTGKTSVRQAYLEAANTSPTSDMGSMITAMREFEADQKVMQTEDDQMGKAISDLSGVST